MSADGGPQVAGAVSELLQSFLALLRINASMTRAELAASLSRAIKGVVAAAIGLVVAAYAIGFAFFAAYLWLIEDGFRPVASAGMIAGALAILVVALALLAVTYLRNVSAVPHRSIAEFRRTLVTLRAAAEGERRS